MSQLVHPGKLTASAHENHLKSEGQIFPILHDLGLGVLPSLSHQHFAPEIMMEFPSSESPNFQWSNIFRGKLLPTRSLT